MNDVEIIKVASFELIREKRKKVIKNQKFFTKSIPPGIMEALEENLKALLSFPEAEIKRDTGEKPPIICDTPLLNKIRDSAQSLIEETKEFIETIEGYLRMGGYVS